MEDANDPRKRHDRRLGLVVLVSVMAALLAVGLLLDSVTESTLPKKKVTSLLPVAVAAPGAVDDFDRASPQSLEAATSGQRWQAHTGVWETRNGQARVADAKGGPALATLGVGSPNVLVEATVAEMAPGWGLAFRCRGPINCWRLEAVPDLGTWNVILVVQGEERELGNVGVVSVANGTRVGVRTFEDRIEVLIDGSVVRTIREPALNAEARAGLSLREAASADTAAWSSFSVAPVSGPGVADVAGALVHDMFARDDADGLTADDTPAWVPTAGSWGIRDRQAALLAAAGDGASIALVDGVADGVVQATVMVPQQNTGIAFRCSDANNCWRVVAGVGVGTWNVVKVVDGDVRSMGNIGLATTVPGTTISVVLDGPRITFVVNGREERTIEDDFNVDETGAGLAVEGGQFATSSRWSEFVVSTSKGES